MLYISSAPARVTVTLATVRGRSGANCAGGCSFSVTGNAHSGLSAAAASAGAKTNANIPISFFTTSPNVSCCATAIIYAYCQHIEGTSATLSSLLGRSLPRKNVEKYQDRSGNHEPSRVVTGVSHIPAKVPCPWRHRLNLTGDVHCPNCKQSRQNKTTHLGLHCLGWPSWHRIADNGASFDHFVGAEQQLPADREPERLRSPEIDGDFELGRLHHRQVGGLFALEDTADVEPELPR